MTMLTRAQAIEQGYTIDNSAAGRPYGYKRDARGLPTFHVPGVDIYTELEERLLELIDDAARRVDLAHQEGQPILSMWRSEVESLLNDLGWRQS